MKTRAEIKAARKTLFDLVDGNLPVQSYGPTDTGMISAAILALDWVIGDNPNAMLFDENMSKLKKKCDEVLDQEQSAVVE